MRSLNLCFRSQSLSWAHLISLNTSTWMFFRDSEFMTFPPKSSLPDILCSAPATLFCWSAGHQTATSATSLTSSLAHVHSPAQVLYSFSVSFWYVLSAGSNCCHPGRSPPHLIVWQPFCAQPSHQSSQRNWFLQQIICWVLPMFSSKTLNGTLVEIYEKV